MMKPLKIEMIFAGFGFSVEAKQVEAIILKPTKGQDINEIYFINSLSKFLLRTDNLLLQAKIKVPKLVSSMA